MACIHSWYGWHNSYMAMESVESRESLLGFHDTVGFGSQMYIGLRHDKWVRYVSLHHTHRFHPNVFIM